MATMRQHYVPEVYMKAWKTEVEKITEPGNKFQGFMCLRMVSI